MKFSKKTLLSVKIRHIFGLQQTWSYDRMQGSGYLYGILPALKDVYGNNKEKLSEAMLKNIQFFNTSAIFSPLICGVHMALLEDESDDVGQTVKTSMMGPLAGVGDTLAGVIVNPLVTLISCQFGLAGNWLIALLLTLGVRIFWLFVESKLYDVGYKKGAEALASTSQSSLLTEGIHLMSIFGGIVLGGFIPSMLKSIQIGLQYTGKITVGGKAITKVFKVQDMFDSIAPYIVPISLLALIYYLIKKKKLTPIQIMILILFISVIAYYTKILTV